MEDAFWIRKKIAFPPKQWPDSPVAPNSTPVTRRGMYSDDCEMTVGLMNALIQKGTALDSTAMLQAWRDEWELAGRQRIGHGSIRFFWSGQQPLEEIQQAQ